MTHTYAIMKVSSVVYQEIKKKLEDAGYMHAFHVNANGQSVIDMNGIGLVSLNQAESKMCGTDPLEQ